MLFFKNKLDRAEPPSAPPERRQAERFAIGADFPITCVVTFFGADKSGGIVAKYKVKLVNLSERGVRVRLGSVAKTDLRGACELLFVLDECKWTLPGRVTSATNKGDDTHLGVRWEPGDDAANEAQRRLFDVVALGGTMKLSSAGTTPDAAGYLTDHFQGTRARLTVWRQPQARWVLGFQLTIDDNVIRAGSGVATQFLTADSSGTLHPASTEKAAELQRLLRWITPNFSAAVPRDVQNFIRKTCGMNPLPTA